MLPGMACSEKCTAFPCVAKLAGAAFPACQAAIEEFNALAAVQAWRGERSQPKRPKPGRAGQRAELPTRGAAGCKWRRKNGRHYRRTDDGETDTRCICERM